MLLIWIEGKDQGEGLYTPQNGDFQGPHSKQRDKINSQNTVCLPAERKLQNVTNFGKNKISNHKSVVLFLKILTPFSPQKVS